ncbi:MAG: DUF5009 domain-containing protein [Chitinophagaceae bacterium]|nr:DUF5009 domain-containing protein [Chitinophagaceae bacterium]
MTQQKRLLSIDALRGFDMLLISGGGAFIVYMKGITNQSWIDSLADQLEHPAWMGFTFYDFIFPLFLFTAGVSLAFSMQSGLKKGVSKKELYKKAFKRFLILFLLGILDKNVPLNIFDPAHVRYGTVLGRIGFATLVTTFLYLNLSGTKRLLWVAGVLTVYCAALFLIPVPGYGAGDLSFEGNLVGWFDRTFMPGRLLQKTYDENALLTQLPAHCLTVLGAAAGDVLQKQWKEYKKLGWLVAGGVICITAGLIWAQFFPLNKHLWTSSFILLTGGMAFLFLALFYWLIDIQGWRRWTFFFKVIGMNSLVIYLSYRFFDYGYTSRLLFGGYYMHAPEAWHPALNALGGLIIAWTFLYVLYRNKIFVKI